MRAFLLSAATISLLSPSAVQAENVVLEPSSAWHLDYGDDKCRLARTFGEDKQKTILFLDQHQPSETFTWTMAGQAVGAFASARRFTSQFGPAFSPRKTEASSSTVSGDLEGYGRAIIMSGHLGDTEFKAKDEETEEPVGLPHLDAAKGGDVEWLEIRRSRDDSLRLQTGNMAPAFKALNDCITNLVSHWGLDATAQSSRVTAPEWTNARQVLRRIQSDYPDTALRKGEQARMNVRVMVDAAGRPTNCVLTDVTKAENFDNGPCQLIMRNAEFEPARDARGAGVASFYATSIVYIIE